MVEIRVTRLSLYPAGSPPDSHEGHYFRGETYEDAVFKAKTKFPNEELSFKIFKRLINNEWVME